MPPRASGRSSSKSSPSTVPGFSGGSTLMAWPPYRTLRRRPEDPASRQRPMLRSRPVSDSETYRSLFDLVRPAVESAEGRTRVLEAIAWPRAVEDRFFARGACELPEVDYEVDRASLQARVAELRALI